MAKQRFDVTPGELARLIVASGPGKFHVHVGLGTGKLHLDLAHDNDRKVAEALLAMREANQHDKDRVGDPR